MIFNNNIIIEVIFMIWTKYFTELVEANDWLKDIWPIGVFEMFLNTELDSMEWHSNVQSRAFNSNICTLGF